MIKSGLISRFFNPNMFKTIKKITKSFGARFMGIILVMTLAGSANAGILDWFGTEDKIPQTSNFHSLAFIEANSNFNGINSTTENSMFVGDNFLLASKTPTKNVFYGLARNISARELYVPMTGYSSTPDQTDSSPFITANGTYVHDGVIAANFLPFGTKIKIPDYFGDKIFTVHDRMNKRYWQKVDIWFPDRQSALEFGLRTLKIQILES